MALEPDVSRQKRKTPKKKRIAGTSMVAPAAHHLSTNEDNSSLHMYRNRKDDSPPSNGNSSVSKAKPRGSQPNLSISSDGGGNSSENSGSSGEEEEQSNALIENSTSKIAAHIINTASGALPPFQPPSGFEAAYVIDKPRASQFLVDSALEGKQIWYFTAPAALPISAIREISLKTAQEGKVALTYKRNNYGFSPDAAFDRTYTTVLMPNQDHDGFRSSFKTIDRVFHIQQIVNLSTSNAALGSVNSSSWNGVVAAAKHVRQQPEGLKMRFHPIGFHSFSESADVHQGGQNATPPGSEMGDGPEFRKPERLQEESGSDHHIGQNMTRPHVRRRSKDSLMRKRDRKGVKKAKNG